MSTLMIEIFLENVWIQAILNPRLVQPNARLSPLISDKQERLSACRRFTETAERRVERDYVELWRGLRNWESGDDAWVEHARWFPKCSFLLQNRGVDFVTLVQSVQNEQAETTLTENPPSSLDIDQLPAAVKVHEMGYSWETIKATYIQLNKPGIYPI
uniref:Baculoviral IAP repeat-containing protein 3 n=1 Tax=Magallana gigas TaxID=29159 RepID=K1PHD9_MAGGI